VRRLRDAGSALVLVLGDPRYYGRHGFVPVGPAGPQPPYAIEMPEAWQVRELEAGALARAEGMVRCAESLEDPAHW
ncbi:MAG: hypothetical protein V2J24_20280, partial [Pseudomonadales bacterium]|nr:hypothetical protein [Pseudomonadales bacterium]